MALPSTSGLPALYRRLTTGPAFIQARYGTARGLGRLLLAEGSRRIGRFRDFEKIDWRAVRRLVFVCSGNICRSPYAEARARALGYRAASFALRGDAGLPADAAALAAAKRRDLDLGAHRATNRAGFAVKAGDIMIGMEPWQGEALRALVSNSGCQVTLLGLWSRPRRAHLHDPHTLSPRYFDTCFTSIDSAVQAIAALAQHAATETAHAP